MTPLPAAVVAILALVLGQVPGPQPQRWPSYPDMYSQSRGNCQKCAPGEAMAVSIQAIPQSNYVDIDDPPCADLGMREPRLSPEMTTALVKAFYNQTGRTAVFALGISDSPRRSLEVQQPSGLPGLLKKATRTHQTSSCSRNVVIVPKGATVTRVQPGLRCPAGGWCTHQFQPQTQDLDENLRAFTIVGKNWSHNTTATTTLEIYYRR